MLFILSALVFASLVGWLLFDLLLINRPKLCVTWHSFFCYYQWGDKRNIFFIVNWFGVLPPIPPWPKGWKFADLTNYPNSFLAKGWQSEGLTGYLELWTASKNSLPNFVPMAWSGRSWGRCVKFALAELHPKTRKNTGYLNSGVKSSDNSFLVRRLPRKTLAISPSSFHSTPLGQSSAMSFSMRFIIQDTPSVLQTATPLLKGNLGSSSNLRIFTFLVKGELRCRVRLGLPPLWSRGNGGRTPN